VSLHAIAPRIATRMDLDFAIVVMLVRRVTLAPAPMAPAATDLTVYQTNLAPPGRTIFATTLTG
jgi:hypothetical protein